MPGYEQPKWQKEAFTCPHCGVLSHQSWAGIRPVHREIGPLLVALCDNCGEPSIWFRQLMVYPSSVSGPVPNADLPDEIKIDYEEARSIASLSPRGAAALVRLAIQKLCNHLDAKGKTLNEQIGYLVKQGLDPLIQKSLDSVRVIGNEAVHPGQIDMKDDEETAARLFELVNLIAERMITYPKRIDEVYQRLPEGKRKAIEERDKAKGDVDASA